MVKYVLSADEIPRIQSKLQTLCPVSTAALSTGCVAKLLMINERYRLHCVTAPKERFTINFERHSLCSIPSVLYDHIHQFRSMFLPRRDERLEAHHRVHNRLMVLDDPAQSHYLSICLRRN